MLLINFFTLNQFSWTDQNRKIKNNLKKTLPALEKGHFHDFY